MVEGESGQQSAVQEAGGGAGTAANQAPWCPKPGSGALSVPSADHGSLSLEHPPEDVRPVLGTSAEPPAPCFPARGRCHVTSPRARAATSRGPTPTLSCATLFLLDSRGPWPCPLGPWSRTDPRASVSLLGTCPVPGLEHSVCHSQCWALGSFHWGCCERAAVDARTRVWTCGSGSLWLHLPSVGSQGNLASKPVFQSHRGRGLPPQGTRGPSLHIPPILRPGCSRPSAGTGWPLRW